MIFKSLAFLILFFVASSLHIDHNGFTLSLFIENLARDGEKVG